MNYRAYFQDKIIDVQRQLDREMLTGNWSEYLTLRHEMIAIKEHVTAHESRCGYDCKCAPDQEGKRLLGAKP